MLIPPIDKAADYRRRAKETRETAQWISLQDIKQHLLETARHLETLAESEAQKARQIAPIRTPKPDT